MTKVHLFDSDEPIREGETLTALCQEEIPHAAFVFMWDDNLSPNWSEFVFSMRVCRKCLHIEIEKRYVYGIRSAQSELDARREEVEAVA